MPMDLQKAVLFVDDEEIARKVFQKAARGRYEVLLAASVSEAEEILAEKSEEIGVICTDQRMPGEEGVVLLQRARRQYPRIPRILVTAYSEFSILKEAINKGSVYRFLVKPYEFEDLALALDRALEDHAIHEERDQLLHQRARHTRRSVLSDRIADLGALVMGMGHHLRNSLVPVKSFLDLTEASGLEADERALREAAEFKIGAVLDRLGEIEQWRTGQSQGEATAFTLKTSLPAAFTGIREYSVQYQFPEGFPDVFACEESVVRAFDVYARVLGQMAPVGSSLRIEASTEDSIHGIRLRLSLNQPWWDASTAPLDLFDPFRLNRNTPSAYAPHLLEFFFLIDQEGGELHLEPRGNGLLDIVVDLPTPESPAAKDPGSSHFLRRMEQVEKAWQDHLIGI